MYRNIYLIYKVIRPELIDRCKIFKQKRTKKIYINSPDLVSKGYFKLDATWCPLSVCRRVVNFIGGSFDTTFIDRGRYEWDFWFIPPKRPHGTLQTRVKLLKMAEQTKRPNSVPCNKVDDGVYYQFNYSWQKRLGLEDMRRGWRHTPRQRDPSLKFHLPSVVPEGKQFLRDRKAPEQRWRQKIGRCGKMGLRGCI